MKEGWGSRPRGKEEKRERVGPREGEWRVAVGGGRPRPRGGDGSRPQEGGRERRVREREKGARVSGFKYPGFSYSLFSNLITFICRSFVLEHFHYLR